MAPFEIAAIRPFLIFAIGMLSDYLIGHGFLAPENRQAWVDGWTQIIGATGGVILSALLLIHEIKKPHPANTKITQTTTTTDSPTDTTPHVENKVISVADVI